MSDPPPGFTSWEQCRGYYALEALFLGQYYDHHPSPLNKARYMKAADLAFAANKRCNKPYPEEESSDEQR
jgi:hypothetical protein